MKLKISTGNGKMKGIESINTNSLSNPFCQAMSQCDSICKHCYSNRMLSFRKTAADAFENNSQLLSTELLQDWQIPRFEPKKIIRLHSFGELINSTHLINFILIAKKNRQSKFALWTKRADLIKQYAIPKNMILIYSNTAIDNVMTEVPEGFDKVFSVISDKKHAEINCGSRSCINCQKCYKKSTVLKNNVIIEGKK